MQNASKEVVMLMESDNMTMHKKIPATLGKSRPKGSEGLSLCMWGRIYVSDENRLGIGAAITAM